MQCDSQILSSLRHLASSASARFSMNTITQCQNCANLAIEHLVDRLNKGIPIDHGVTRAAYYQLHDSIEGLEVAAGSGCHFCTFLVACLKGYVDNGAWIHNEWKGEDCALENSLLASARNLPSSEVRLCVVSEVSSPYSAFADTRVIDAIFVAVGPWINEGVLGDGSHEQERGFYEFPELLLALSSSRGTYRNNAC